jgi:hypothetical protein
MRTAIDHTACARRRHDPIATPRPTEHADAVPFRSAELLGDDALRSPRPPAPRILAFAVTERVYRLVLAEQAGVTSVAVDRRDATVCDRRVIDGATRSTVAIASRERWAAFDACDDTLFAWTGPTDPTHDEVRFDSTYRVHKLDGAIAALAVDAETCVALTPPAHGDDRRGPAIDVLGTDLEAPRVPDWRAPVSSRTLLAATSTVYGPAAVFSTDRDDEIDVCVAGRGGELLTRTVSLGRGEQFECAVGGGRRILVVSRGSAQIVPRTLASDIRSELNMAPIRARTGWDIGAVRATYANGPFVVAHDERRDDQGAAVLTVFDSGATTTTRLLLPSVGAVAAEGKDIAVATVLSGASAPMLLVQRTTVAGGRDRRYAYLLEQPSLETATARQALLVDAADMLAASLGADAPRSFAHAEHDDAHDVARFTLPGPDAAHDLTFAIRLGARGDAVVGVRIGEGRAPEARGLHFVERVREILTGDDDGDAATTRVELPQLATGIAAVVSAVGALRSVK